MCVCVLCECVRALLCEYPSELEIQLLKVKLIVVMYIFCFYSFASCSWFLVEFENFKRYKEKSKWSQISQADRQKETVSLR